MDSVCVRRPDGTVRRYSEHHVQSVLQFLGCKLNHAPNMAVEILRDLHQQQSTMAESAKTPATGTEETECVEYSAFRQAVYAVLASWQYRVPDAQYDLAWCVRDRRRGICILLGGTSGCGKSTLASLLASRLGVTTVLSTDNIRNVLRSFVSEEENPVLWASSYHAGESLVDVEQDGGVEERVIRGYRDQAEAVFPQLRTTVQQILSRRESVIIEGVHLSVDVMLRLAEELPMCLPFVICINKEAKHAERFATRAKYMTLEPRFNKYMKYFENIRLIQNHLCREADKYSVPKVDNTNVDRSVAVIHSTMLSVLAHIANGTFPQLVDTDTHSTPLLRNSKAMMLRLIRERPLRRWPAESNDAHEDQDVATNEEKSGNNCGPERKESNHSGHADGYHIHRSGRENDDENDDDNDDDDDNGDNNDDNDDDDDDGDGDGDLASHSDIAI
ncbi:P-loop containing nucleoside triphosphate hydrolase protein, partial [Thamnocephalis sphaerospora]